MCNTRMCTCLHVPQWRPEDDLGETVLAFYHGESDLGPLVSAARAFNLLSHLAPPTSLAAVCPKAGRCKADSVNLLLELKTG